MRYDEGESGRMTVLKVRLMILTLLGVVLGVVPGRARDLFVNNFAGDDAKNGNRPDAAAGGGPVRTLDRALRLVRRGDRIVIANTGEPYREMISLCDVEQRGFPDLPLVIQGNG